MRLSKVQSNRLQRRDGRFGEAIRSAPTGERVQTRIPLRCFAESGANFASVGSPIRMQAPKGLVATIRSVHIEEAKESVPCPSKGR
ncbi:MAG: hypothetical protein IPN50_06110 [Sphingomonadales bacterium]|nr:hypothetical protein [Sphingomonadales bacterium]